MAKYLNTTSRNLETENYAWESVVHQFGRPLLDSELNLSQDVLRKGIDSPSGILQRPSQGQGRFIYESPFESGHANPNFRANTLIIERFQAIVAGMKVDVKGTNINDSTLNHVDLGDAEFAGNRRVDFVFLEVWRKEVTPSMYAKCRLRVTNPELNDVITFTDQVTGNTIDIVAGVDFQLTGGLSEIARNFADFINAYDGVNAGMALTNDIVITAETKGTQYLFITLTGGAVANFPDVVMSTSTTGFTVIDQPAGGSDGEGKPSATQIYYSGNADSHSDLWLDDDIIDPVLNISSSRRIQIQYRLRVVGNYTFSPSSNIFGYEHFLVKAQGGASSPSTYSFRRSADDYGLWVAGDGNSTSANEMSCVDGFVYSIPVAFVFRREQSTGPDGFHPIDRFNTGVLSTHTGIVANPFVPVVDVGQSDRPDGLFADEVAEADVLDLRRCVSTRGLDYFSELKAQYHALLDNQNKTWASYSNDLAPTGDGTSSYSHTPLACDVFGDANQTFNIGKHKRNFDHIARRFSNEPVIERFFVLVEPQASGNPNPDGVSHIPHADNVNGYWYEGDQIQIDLSAMDVRSLAFWETAPTSHPFGGDRVTDQLLAGTQITHLGALWHNDGHYTTSVNQQVNFKSVRGLGTNVITLTLSRNSVVVNGGLDGAGDYLLVGDSVNGESVGSSRQVFVEVIIEYPSGDHGLTGVATGVDDLYSAWVVDYQKAYPTGSAMPYGGNPEGGVDIAVGSGNAYIPPVVNWKDGTREVTLEYVYTLTSFDIVSTDQNRAFLPFRYYWDNSASVLEDISSGAPVPLSRDASLSAGSHSEPVVGWTNGWVAGQRRLTVTLNPLCPYTGSEGTSHAVYVFYRRIAPQTCGADFPLANDNISTDSGGVVPIELDLQPLASGSSLTIDMNSAYSFPFTNGTTHLGNSVVAEADGYDEYETMNNRMVFLDDVSIASGFVELPTFLSLAHHTNIKLGRDTNVLPRPPTKDALGRVVYPSMREYFPAVYAKNLGMHSLHYKSAYPCLMKVTSDDHDLFRKGEVVLVVFTNIANWSRKSEIVKYEAVDNDHVVACVYRTRDLILLGD